MYDGTIDHGKIIAAFQRCVPGCYVRDYRDNGGFITICRDYRDMKWNDQMTGGNTYRQVPAVTLASIPRGNVTPATQYRGLRLERPGWRQEFRKASKHLSVTQQKGITESLGVGEVFQGVS